MNHTITSSTRAARRLALLFLVAGTWAVSGCASRAPVAPRPTFKQIAVVPVTSPAAIYTENRMFAAPILPALIPVGAPA